ncbi:hypothetical protein GGR52DRAFT_80901 [Hypoxylon sp. FL1284]|nr:hypothetical protein GGR52DRAFT_80901 [Hypoxylon sp. FL1284]
MDDPWGSPWASSEAASKPDPPAPSPTTSNLLSPPPKAFFGSSSNLQSQSPWADNDGFRDWSGAEQTDVSANELDWGVWADPSSQNSQPSPRLDEFGKRGSIAWPSSAATSPGLRPLPRSRASSIFRHHSPDPWATEISYNNEVHDAPRPPSLSNALGLVAVESQDKTSESGSLAARKQDAVVNPKSVVDGSQPGQDDEIVQNNASQIPEPSSDSRDPRDSVANIAPKVEIHDAPSRPSSTFSQDSVGAAERQDSPITSIDEDPKLRLQAAPRKVSGKVQELVGMYDNMAKVTTDDSPEPTRLEPSRSRSRGRSPSQTRSAEAEEDADFGDFEDAKSEYDGSVAAGAYAPSASPKSSSTPKALSNEAPARNNASEPAEHQSTAPRISPVPVQQLIEKYGPIRFDVDLQSIDEIFPDLAQISNNNTDEAEAREIPDQVIRDNFTTISERKAWYRISRFGSMRRHDSGEEDNYHRVEWPTSRLHNDVIKIVRGWMEVDSISGRATLGAGNRTSVFNWDTSAAPVDLGQVFSRKTSISHSRTSSNAPKQSLDGSIQAPGSPAARSIKSPIKPPGASPMASFGWNSSRASITLPTTSQERRSSHTKSASQPTANIAQPQSETKAHAPVQPPKQPIPIETSLEGDDDDDEWGEMVSSPKIETQPSLSLNAQPLAAPVALADTSVKGDQNTSMTPKLSVSIPQSNQEPKTADQTGSSTKAQRVDPWPPADLSMFESSSARMPKSPKQDPWTFADFSVFEAPSSKSAPNVKGSSRPESRPDSQSLKDDHTNISTASVVETRPPLKAVLGPIQQPDEKHNQDEVVRKIVQALPDLSYMLR